MKKILLIAISMFGALSLTSCFGNDNSNGENSGNQQTSNVELTGITLTTNKDTFLTDEVITVNVSPTPENANRVNGNSYKTSCYEHFYEKDGGQAVRFSKDNASGSFTFKDPGVYVFWSKYCNHSSHSDTSGDVVSNRVNVTVDLPESEKVEYKYDLLSDGTASIYAGKLFSNLIDVTIPSEIDGHNVSEIKSSGFTSFKNVKTLHVSSGIKKIGKYAFNGCSNLRYIHVPDTVTSIGDYAFTGLDSQSYLFYESTSAVGGSYTVLDEINHYMTDVKDFVVNDDYLYAIKNNNQVNLCEYYGKDTEIVIPEKIDGLKIERIAGHCFYKNTSISSLTFNTNEALSAIGNYAFYGCTSLTSLIFPVGLKTIGTYAFYGCSNVEFIVVPDTVTSIGDYAFTSCSEKCYLLYESTSAVGGSYTVLDEVWRYTTGVNGYFEKDGIVYGIQTNRNLSVLYFKGNQLDVVIPSEIDGAKVEKILGHAFYKNTKITSVTLPSTLISIGKYAFYGCTELQEMRVKPGVTSIGAYAFCDCSKLKFISIPSTVSSIGDYAFTDCDDYCRVFFEATSVSFSSYTVLDEMYQYYKGYKDFAIDEENNLVYGLQNSNKFSVVCPYTRDTMYFIPDTFNGYKITMVESYAFYKLSNVENVFLGENIDTIKTKAFSGSVNIEVNAEYYALKEIESYAFEGIKGVNFIWGESDRDLSINNIGDYAFKDVSSTSLYLPHNIGYLGKSCFSGSNIEYVYYDGTVSEFNNISKGWNLTSGWKTGSKIKIIYCSDDMIIY